MSHSQIQNASSFAASGSLEFIRHWKPALDSPAQEIAQLSITGYKEAHDLGYALRQRYPGFYTTNTSFTVWANDYPRVIQTAESFVRGYLGPSASRLATVIAVNSTGSSAAFGNSLGPSDLCPAFDDDFSNFTNTWDAIYLPPITQRLNGLLRGLEFNTSDVSLFPYLCGFETQITGTLSPWCGVFATSELEAYQYRQDLRYWYGSGPGSTVARQMMQPYLNAVVELLATGPGINGTAADGSPFVLPKLLMAFANDGQMNELVSALGVFDDQKPLSPRWIDHQRRYVSSRFVSMRGTVSLEKLQCSRPAANGTDSFIRVLLNDAVYPVVSCQDGPGKSCAMGEYQRILARKYAEDGGFFNACGVANTSLPRDVAGASFFTNLGLPFLRSV
jgi:hypothetical protein